MHLLLQFLPFHLLSNVIDLSSWADKGTFASDMITATNSAKHQWDYISKVTESGFLRLLGKELRSADIDNPKRALKIIEATTDEIFSGNIPCITDKPSQFHALLVSYLIASVEHLSDILGEAEAKRIIGSCFSKNGGFWIKWSMKLGLLFSRHKFSYLVQHCGNGVRDAFGNGFDIEVDTDNKSYLTTIVWKCGFNEILRRHNKEHLTKLMCSWDDNWSDVVNSFDKLSFARPKTIANGCKCCEFKIEAKR